MEASHSNPTETSFPPGAVNPLWHDTHRSKGTKSRGTGPCAAGGSAEIWIGPENKHHTIINPINEPVLIILPPFKKPSVKPVPQQIDAYFRIPGVPVVQRDPDPDIEPHMLPPAEGHLELGGHIPMGVPV